MIPGKFNDMHNGLLHVKCDSLFTCINAHVVSENLTHINEPCHEKNR